MRAISELCVGRTGEDWELLADWPPFAATSETVNRAKPFRTSSSSEILTLSSSCETTIFSPTFKTKLYN